MKRGEGGKSDEGKIKDSIVHYTPHNQSLNELINRLNTTANKRTIQLHSTRFKQEGLSKAKIV